MVSLNGTSTPKLTCGSGQRERPDARPSRVLLQRDVAGGALSQRACFMSPVYFR